MSRHSLGDGRRPRDTFVVVILAAVIVVVAVGAALTWPTHKVKGAPLPRYGAVVVDSQRVDCDPGSAGCVVEVRLRLSSGSDQGTITTLTFVPGATDPELRVGEHVTLNRGGTGADTVYSFADVDRGRPMLLIALIFVVVALVVGRTRGLAALIGLVFAGTVLVQYLIPALLAGESPLVVSLLAGASIAVVAMPIAHGVSMRSAAALLGSLGGMAIAGVASRLSLSALHFTGLSSDESTTLHVLDSHATVPGLLLCATVIGALGVLNDVTITQASAVFELAEAGPTLSRGALVRAATRIGHDHIASTIYSLVLAYAGAALPLLLLFEITDQPVATVLTSDAIGPEVFSGLIGATALILMVPFTTLIAAALTMRTAEVRPSIAFPPGRPAPPVSQPSTSFERDEP